MPRVHNQVRFLVPAAVVYDLPDMIGERMLVRLPVLLFQRELYFGTDGFTESLRDSIVTRGRSVIRLCPSLL